MRTFTTTRTNPQTGEAPDSVTFDLDGVIMTAVRPKTAVTLDLASQEGAPTLQQIHAIQRFLNATLDESSRVHLNKRLWDPKDDLDVTSPEFMRIVQYIVEEVVARPTRSSSPSIAQPGATGGPSTVTSEPAVSTP